MPTHFHSHEVKNVLAIEASSDERYHNIHFMPNSPFSGYFCGSCLKNRYGEDAREVLKDPNWACPVCRDECNCSICRNRIGKEATGPITWLAQRKGYDSVKDYLAALRPSGPFVAQHDNDNEEEA
jgi:hypothetical protein